jgi:hypothetical protein
MHGVSATSATAAGEQAALPASISVSGAALALWPAGQTIAPLSAPLMAITTFADHAAYHPALIAAALAAENDPRFRGEMFRGACGTKVRNVPGWNAACADDGASDAVAETGLRGRQLGEHLSCGRLLHAAQPSALKCQHCLHAGPR